MRATVLQFRLATDKEGCSCASCGVDFYSPIIERRRGDGASFYCPNGHPNVFGQSDAEKLRKDLAAEKARREQAERDAQWAKAEAVNHKIQRTKAVNKLNRITARVNAGVCPHCNRTFKQLAAHMKTKHPSVALNQEFVTCNHN